MTDCLTNDWCNKTADQTVQHVADNGAERNDNGLLHTTTTTIVSMQETMGKKNQVIKRGHTAALFLQHITSAAHASVLLFMILIIYCCFSEEFLFFTWHPLLMSIGWMFLLFEGILSISQNNIFSGTLSKTVRVRLHWIFQAVALILVGAAFIVVVINKNNLNKVHFKSWHALIGFIAILSAIPAAINGTAALYSGRLRHYVKPKFLKIVHVICGIVAFSFGGVTLILSVYTKWFAEHSNHNSVTFFLAILFVVIALGGTLLHPVIVWYKRFSNEWSN